jgi:hypothetical protein
LGQNKEEIGSSDESTIKEPQSTMLLERTRILRETIEVLSRI